MAKNEGRSCHDYVELTRSYLASAGRTRFSPQQKYSRTSQAFRLKLTRDVQKSTIYYLKGKLGVPCSCLLDLLLVCFAIRPAFCSLSISQATEPLSLLMKLCIVQNCSFSLKRIPARFQLVAFHPRGSRNIF